MRLFRHRCSGVGQVVLVEPPRLGHVNAGRPVRLVVAVVLLAGLPRVHVLDGAREAVAAAGMFVARRVGPVAHHGAFEEVDGDGGNQGRLDADDGRLAVRRLEHVNLELLHVERKTEEAEF